MFFRFLRSCFLASLATVGLFLLGCSHRTPVSTLDPKGPLAQMQLDLFMVTLWVTLFIFVVVGGALGWAVWKFRARKDDDQSAAPPAQTHGNPLIEMGLIVASVLLLVIIAIPTLQGIWMMHELPDEVATGEIPYLEVNVEGYQWWFGFEYPEEGITTSNELTIPVGTVVKLNLRSNDVIHSFWVPKIAGKVDLMPGRKNWMWIQADETGHYYGQCAEFCGKSHAYMLFRVNVVEPEQFDAWVADYKEGVAPPTADSPTLPAEESMAAWGDFARADLPADASMAAEGAKLFFSGKTGCVQCHAIGGSPAGGVSGPNLTRLADRYSLAAGILDHRPDHEGPIDRELQYENLVSWLTNPEDHKAGNLMWAEGIETGVTAGMWSRTVITPSERDRIEAGEVTEEEILANKVTREDYEKIAAFLMTLRSPLPVAPGLPRDDEA